MAVSKDNRKVHEQGVKDSHKGFLKTALNDIIVNYPNSSAYYRSRDERRLDGDKKRDKQ